jgi:menaquinone-specific isochorismate synthase
VNRFVNLSTHSFNVKDGLINQLLSLFNSGALITKAPKRIIRLEIPFPDHTPLQWLRWQTDSVCVYWSDRCSEFECAGIGYADKIKRDGHQDGDDILSEITRCIKEDAGRARYYGGIRFNARAHIDKYWSPYGESLFILPQFEVVTDASGTYLASNIVARADQKPNELLQSVLKKIANLRLDAPLNEYHENTPHHLRTDIPSKQDWFDNIDTALNILDTEKVDKIVLGRSSILSFDSAPKPFFLLSKLKEIEPSAYHFYIQPKTGSAFIGATPERLYKRRNRFIETEAVAGTRQRGATPEEDERLAEHLLLSDKDYREHVMVRNNIESVLAPLCQYLRVNDRVELIKQSRVQHLYSYLQGQLLENISDRQLLNVLHPTPAVGGLPRDSALEYIEKMEPFDRGWYAGPVGWIGDDAAEFAVGIRSGLMNGKSLRLFAGAGVIKGSIPQLEWDEMETKISAFMNALGIA